MALPAGAQELGFAVQAGGTGFDQGYGIAVDGAGASVVTGAFSDTATFGVGEQSPKTLTAAGGGDIFVAKYNPDGALVFAVQAGGTGADAGLGIAVDHTGASTVTGRFRGTATFGAGEPNATTLNAAGDDDIFVAKYNPDGTLDFAVQAGGVPGNDVGLAIAVDCTGASVVTGFFSGTATFGAGEPNATTLIAAGGSNDIFVAKYNPDGTLAFAIRAGGRSTDMGTGIAVDGAGASTLTGWFSGTATFGVGEPNPVTLTAAASRDVFVAKYKPDGTLDFAVQAGGDLGNDVGLGIAVDDAGASTVTGFFLGIATFGAGEPNATTLTATDDSDDIFVAKYNPDGTLVFAVQAGGSGSDVGFGIAAGAAGATAVTGQFSGMATFGAGGPNPTTLTSAGETDVFTAKYNLDGTLAFAVQAGGSGADSSRAIGMDNAGASTVAGSFHGTALFGAGEPNATTLTAAGEADIFVAKHMSSGGSLQQQIEALIEQIRALVDDGVLRRTQRRRLNMPLNRALRDLDRGEPVRACFDLDVFVARARLQVGLDNLPEDDGKPLIEGAVAAIDELDCHRL